jgi:hypothetical protein
MEVSDYLHALVTLRLGKEPMVATGEELDWVPDQVWTLWRRKKLAFVGLLQDTKKIVKQ